MKQHVLAVLVLLLTLNLSVSAQNRSPEEALKGVGGFGVSVKYANVDGLPEEMRAPVLTELHDRAKNLLMQADMPFVESINDTDLDGNLRLVFTVTMTKATGKSMPVRVETGLSERVRLRRDESKEIDLATWVQAGIGGPISTTKMLFDVFDGQVQGFIKDYQRANPKPTKVAIGPTTAPAQLKENANSLQGLKGIRVFAPLRKEMNADPELRAALQQLVNAEAEKMIKEAGIPILKYANESEAAGNPILYLWVKLSGPDYLSPAIEIETRFWQQARPLRDTREDLQVVTWESQASDAGPITDDAVIQVVRQQLDEFIKAYNAANPKVAAVRN
jgi:hypothetical protein